MGNKVGVITHWWAKDNYGQKLQAYALQIVLRNLGYDPFLIRYITDGGHQECSERMCAFYSLKAYVKYRIKQVLLLFDKDRKKRMQEFIRTQLSVSHKLYTRYSIFKFPPEADFYITGSDQVWNKLDGSYFLDFVKNGNPRISYAASFGGRNYTAQEAEYVKSWLKKFSSISVREKEGLILCDRLGILNSELVPDPTLLLEEKEYKNFFTGSVNHRSPYLFLYLLEHECDFDAQQVYDFAKKHNLEVVYVISQGEQDSFPKAYPTVPQWLELLSNARYVVTNSFHGMVFSLIFERNFISVPLSGKAGKMNDRQRTLLTHTNLVHRFTNDCDMLLGDISFIEVKGTLEKLRKEGLNFLENSLEDSGSSVV